MYTCVCFYNSTQSVLWQIYETVQSVLCHVTGQMSYHMSLPSILFHLLWNLHNFRSCASRRYCFLREASKLCAYRLVLRTGNFVGYCQGCVVLTVQYYKIVLKCTAHKRTYTTESMEEGLQLMKDAGLSLYTVSKQFCIWWDTLKSYTQNFWSIITVNIAKLLVMPLYMVKSLVG